METPRILIVDDEPFLPRVLEKRAQVESTCAVSGREIRFAVTPNVICFW